ncbi:MAG TPA: peptidase M19 [Verrucomicrobiae bacterium]|nr:peptidase M19 [Verrucomicrobiae bacterium]
MSRLSKVWMSVAVLGLAACSASEQTPVPGGPIGPVTTAYDLANRCLTLKANESYVARGTDGYVTGVEAAAAELFFMKPAGLGRYIFFGKDKRYLTGAANPVAGSAVTAEAAPLDGADWTFTEIAPGRYEAVTQGQALGVAAGELVLSTTAAALTFEPATGCTVYPEMPTDIGDTFTGPSSGELIGYADIHAHMAMGSDMSDGSGDRGPSAGGVMYGHAVDRFGVVEALKDCVDMHGEGGSRTSELVLDGEPDPHDTVGWPTFVDWPAKDSQLHQQMYYKFVERSWKAGQRLMVLHGTSIEALCDVGKKASGDKTSDCTDMGVGMKQVAYAHDMEGYVDAQFGGPGKGWFRIVKTPEEAEAVIRAGKMAVIPGLEFSNIFKCNVTYRNGNTGDEVDGEVVGCTPQIIDEQIEEAWDAGVRGIFLYHDVDSALGGTGIFSEVLNAVNYYGTKGWWRTYTCDTEWAGDDDKGYFYGAGAVMLGAGDYAPLFGNPVGQELIGGANGQFPVYGPEKQCNARFTTELGRYALAAAMKKGFVLDIDHAEIMIKQEMLDEAAKTTPAYPMISAHGGHGGFTNAQVLQMLRQGGIMYPGMVNGREYTGFYNKVEAIWTQMSAEDKAKYPIAVGYGADQNGLANQPGPRSGDGVVPVDYSNVNLFSGAGWSSRLLALPDVKVDKLTVPESGKSWNVDEVGVAHYGMIPDVVEQIRLESGGDTKYLDGFYRSADAYVRLWKQTVAASAQRATPAHPDPSTIPQYVAHPIDPSTGPPPAP